MAYFYVKSGFGTCVTTSGALTEQTGAFGSGSLTAANVYATIASALTNGLANVAGSYIFCSDLHVGSTAASVNWGGPWNGPPVTIASVDDTAVDTIKAGAVETNTGSANDLTISRNITSIAMYYKPKDWMKFSGSTIVCVDCTFHLYDSVGNKVESSIDGSAIVLIDCTFIYDSLTDTITIGGGATLNVKGGKIAAAGTVSTTNHLMRSGFTAGGGTAYFSGVDMSTITLYLLNAVGADSGVDDCINVQIDSCNLNSGVSFTNENFLSGGQTLLVTRSGSDSAAEYQYYFQTYGGRAEEDTVIYRNNSTAFPSGQKVSLKCDTVTDANCTQSRPMIFKFPTRYAELSNASTDVLRIYLLTSTTLTDADVWVEVVYPDGTNIYVPNKAYSVADSYDPFRTGTTLTTNTEAWTGRTTENRYQIDIDTSGDVGSDGVPEITMYVAKQTTIYFCPTLGLS